jgi:MoxR-like ATPase
MPTATLTAFNNLRDTLAASLIEREPEIDAMLLGLVAREHVLLVGPPGTAKSTLINSLTGAIEGARSFSVLLTKFTTPEEIFGPIKVSALREDRYERSIDGYLPTVEIAFLDEIWKASSAILNTTLTLLQERKFDNGAMRVACPLQLAIAASNEWPSVEEGQELGAVFDRFLIRRVVKPVSPANRDKLLFNWLPSVSKQLTLTDINDAIAHVGAVTFSDDAKAALHQILDNLAGAGIRPGDRRSRKSVNIARAAAWLAGSIEVEPAHLECLADVLWSSPEQIDQTAEIVLKVANPVGSVVMDLMREVNEILSADLAETPAQAEASKKLGPIVKRVKELATQNPANKRVQDLKTYVTRENAVLSGRIMGMDDDQLAMLRAGSVK